MKKIFIFPIFYVLLVYFYVLLGILKINMSFINAMLIILFFISCSLNVYISIKCCATEHRDDLLKCSIIIKYLLIPFYIFGALVIMASLALMIIPHLSFMIVAAFIFTIIGWIILLFGNPYLISYIVVLYKEKKIDVAFLIIHIASSFFFCLDVINTMWFSIKNKVLKKVTIFAISILIIFFVLIVFIGVFYYKGA